MKVIVNKGNTTIEDGYAEIELDNTFQIEALIGALKVAILHIANSEECELSLFE